MLKLLVEDWEGKSKSADIDLDSRDITIGRKEDNFIRLKEINVSRHHARIYKNADGIFVEPVAARYGLKVKSAKIDGPTKLEMGDDIQVGDYHISVQDEAYQAKLNVPEEIVNIDDPQMRARLVVMSSNFAGREFPVTRSKVTIGREPESDIQIPHSSVSKVHAEIHRTRRGDYEIVDLGSSNGTKVNGIEVHEPFKLNSGDTIMLGHVIMRYCGPGDFWSLNYGINDGAKQNKTMMLVFIAVSVVLVAVVGILAVKVLNPDSQPANNVTVNNVDDSKSKLLELVMYAKDAISDGDFEQARDLLDQAAKINENDPGYLRTADKLGAEISSRDALNDLKEALSDKDCSTARDALGDIKEDTWAHKRVNNDGLKDKVRECEEERIYELAAAALEGKDTAAAEEARENLRKINPNSFYIKKIDDGIRALRPKTSRGGGGGGGAAKLDALKAQWASAKPAEKESIGPEILKLEPKNIEVLCQMGTFAKIKKKNCDAYKYYKVVQEQGKDCKPPIKDFVAKNAAACN